MSCAFKSLISQPKLKSSNIFIYFKKELFLYNKMFLMSQVQFLSKLELHQYNFLLVNVSEIAQYVRTKCEMVHFI